MRNTLFMLTLMMIGLPIGDAFAYRNNCSFAVDPGKYCYNAGNKKDCPVGCYCVGHTKFAVGNDSDRNPNTACSSKNPSVKDHLYNAGINYCPADFPLSPPGARELSQCYYVSSINSSSVYYAEVECPAGQYLPRLTQKCVKCSESVYCLDCDKASPNARGYICEGTKGKKVTPKDTDQGVKKCDEGKKPNTEQTQCISDTKSCNSGFYLPGLSVTVNGVTTAMNTSCAPCPNDSKKVCPGGEWTRASYNQGIENCLNGLIANNTHTECVIDPSVTIECPPGTYLPERGNSCGPCNNEFNSAAYNHVCIGGTFHMSNTPQGIGEKCEAPSKPDHKAGKCTRDTVRCIEGTYLKAKGISSNDCIACPSDKLCPGGYFEIGWDTPQGLLDKKEVTVEPGYYLPKSSTEPKKCTSTLKYCPGGKYETSTSRDQGIVDCPKNSQANDAKTACAITLTKKQLMYGVNGSGGKYSENALQCWTKKDETDYKNCMGFTADGYKPTDNTGIGKVFKEARKIDFIRNVDYKNMMQVDLSELEK